MILSNQGIQYALKSGALAITPEPKAEQYTTSAVDLFLGEEFQVWDRSKLNVPGAKIQLNLAEQKFTKTAEAYLTRFQKERDGSVIFPPYHADPIHMLAITRERVHLKHGSRLAARV